VFEDCNEEYVVLHISFASFVITDFSNLYSLELKRFDSKIRFERKQPIRRSLTHFFSFRAELSKIFRSLAVNDRLPKSKLSEFFDQAEMHPTQGEVDAAFNAAFKG